MKGMYVKPVATGLIFFYRMKNYYEILGLSVTATDREIKYVFRRLAVTYHPDKNPTPESEAIFKEVNEAYEVLSDPVKRSHYNQLLSGNHSGTVPDQAESWHRDPAYRKRRQAGYKPQPQGPSANILLMESLLKYMRILSWIGCTLSFILLVDYLLPHRISKERIVTSAEAMRKVLLRPAGDLLMTDKGHHFPISYSETKYFPYRSEVRVFSSALFSILVKVENQSGNYELNNLGSLYRNFSFAPLVMFLLSLTGLVSRKGIEFRFNIGIVLLLVFLLNIIFFFTSRI